MWFLLLLILASLSEQGNTLNNNNCTDLSNVSCTNVVLSEGQQVQNNLVIENKDSVSYRSGLTQQVRIECVDGTGFTFKNISRVVIENVVFVGCGHHLNSSYGLRFINVQQIELTNITISNSSYGALQILSSGNISVENIAIVNIQLESSEAVSSIVSFFNCQNIWLMGATILSDNSHKNFQNHSVQCDSDANLFYTHLQTVLLVNSSALYITGSLKVTGNSAPSGIVYLTNVQTSMLVADTIALFAHNKVCVNGALFFNSSNVTLTGKFLFQENAAQKYFFHKFRRIRSTASIGLSQSTLSVNGNLEFSQNSGDITSIYSYPQSTVTVSGTIALRNNKEGYTGIYIRSDSILTIIGTGEFSNNRVLNSVIRLQNGRLFANGTVTFLNNSGNSPCVFRVGSNATFHGSVLFKNNSGALYMVDSTAMFDGDSKFLYNNIHDFGIGGTVAMFRSILYLYGQYLFEGNTVSDVDGGVVYGHVSSMIFSGNGSFIGNSARYGGAVYFQNKPHFKLKKDTFLRFINNTAIKGGAFYVFGSIDSFRCNETQTQESDNTPPCFIDFSNADDHTLIFENNTAKEGGSILQLKFVEDYDFSDDSNTLESCSDCAFTFFTDWNSESNSKPQISSDTFSLCFCKDGIPDCSQVSQTVSVARGDSFSVEVAIMTLHFLRKNQLHVTRSYFQVLTSDATRLLNGTSQHVHEGCNALNYSLQTTSNVENIVISADESCEVSNAQLLVVVNLIDCPEGFSLSGGACVCDSHINRFLASCDLNTGILKKHPPQSNTWGTWIAPYHPNGAGSYGGMIFYEYCPFEYCSRSTLLVSPSDPDSQCENNRTGVICGQCKEGYSRILGSERCLKCTNSYLALLIPFAILGILLICFLFLTQLTVATGTINGVILYANVVNANRSAFLPGNFCPFYTVFISWLNLDFGIDTCFYNGMNQLQYTVWQFVFPLYLWLIVGFVIIICHCSVRVSKFFSKSDPVAVLATIILLSYNKMFQNVIAIFSVAHVQYPPNASGVNSTVWYLDGNVVYGESFHIVLCGVGIVVLVLLFLPYTFVLVFAQLLEKVSFISTCLTRLRLTPFIKTYQAPYKSTSRFWIGLCLLLRCSLLSTLAGADDSNLWLLAISLVCFLLITIMAGLRGIYSKYWLDLLEISYIANLGFLSLVTYHLQVTGIRTNIRGYLSVSVAFITFIAIIAIQIIRRLRKVPKVRNAAEKVREKMKPVKDKEPIKKPVERTSSDLSAVTSQELVMLSDDSFRLELREPLLEEPVTH